MATLPEHKTYILYSEVYKYYTVMCNLCGKVGGPYHDLKKAENRKSTHDRGQDAGADR